MMTPAEILVGDIGGTNVRFARASQSRSGEIKLTHFVKWAAGDFTSLMAAIHAYVEETRAVPTHISLAVAGPVNHGAAWLTNRDWSISESELSTAFSLDGAKIVNDFAAMTRSAPEMGADAFEAVRAGEPLEGAPILVAGPGTGFGAGYLVPIGDAWRVIPSEGGHIAYAPRTQFDMDVALVLGRTHDFVSVELVSAGCGLDDVHAAVCEVLGQPYARLAPQEIKQLADAGDAVCSKVCAVRSEAAMGAVGDLVLAGGARGGVVLAGGVSEGMIDWLKKPASMARFLERGTHSAYVESIPIRLLKSPKAPLVGAAALYLDI